VSLLPIPGIDGGPILKWSLVEKGYEIAEADQVVQRINGPLSLTLGLFSGWAFLNKKNLAGVFSALLALISFGIFTGKIKEDEITI
jgi:Zn-dependent protease